MKAYLANRTEVQYRFRYERDSAGRIEKTTCQIARVLNKDQAVLLGEGMVRRYPKDPDNKSIARKAAFTKAVQALPRDDRTCLWHYFIGDTNTIYK